MAYNGIPSGIRGKARKSRRASVHLTCFAPTAHERSPFRTVLGLLSEPEAEDPIFTNTARLLPLEQHPYERWQVAARPQMRRAPGQHDTPRIVPDSGTSRHGSREATSPLSQTQSGESPCHSIVTVIGPTPSSRVTVVGRLPLAIEAKARTNGPDRRVPRHRQFHGRSEDTDTGVVMRIVWRKHEGRFRKIHLLGAHLHERGS